MGRPKGSKNKPKTPEQGLTDRQRQDLQQDVALAKDPEKKGRQLPAAKKTPKNQHSKYFSCTSAGCDATILVQLPVKEVGDSKTIKFNCPECKMEYKIRASVRIVFQDIN